MARASFPFRNSLPSFGHCLFPRPETTTRRINTSPTTPRPTPNTKHSPRPAQSGGIHTTALTWRLPTHWKSKMDPDASPTPRRHHRNSNRPSVPRNNSIVNSNSSIRTAHIHHTFSHQLQQPQLQDQYQYQHQDQHQHSTEVAGPAPSPAPAPMLVSVSDGGGGALSADAFSDDASTVPVNPRSTSYSHAVS